jgi:hypothetical protein
MTALPWEMERLEIRACVRLAPCVVGGNSEKGIDSPDLRPSFAKAMLTAGLGQVLFVSFPLTNGTKRTLALRWRAAADDPSKL